jgi:hypothetical protein
MIVLIISLLTLSGASSKSLTTTLFSDSDSAAFQFEPSHLVNAVFSVHFNDWIALDK